MAKEPKISFQDLEVGKLEALLLKIKPLLEACRSWRRRTSNCSTE